MASPAFHRQVWDLTPVGYDRIVEYLRWLNEVIRAAELQGPSSLAEEMPTEPTCPGLGGVPASRTGGGGDGPPHDLGP